MVFNKRAWIDKGMSLQLSITHHDDDPFEVDWGNHIDINHIVIRVQMSNQFCVKRS